MARIAIPKIRDDRKPVEYRVRLDPQMDDQLQLYRKLYIQTYGQQIEAKDLLAPVISRFLETDRGFKDFKRRLKQTKPGSKPMTKTPPPEASPGALPGGPDQVPPKKL